MSDTTTSVAATDAAQDPRWPILRDLLSEHLGQPADCITQASTLDEDLNTDELDRLEIAMAMETRWGIDISDDELEAARTAGDLLALIPATATARSAA